MVTTDFWLEVGGPFGDGGLVHRSSCDAGPRMTTFILGRFLATREAVSAARDYVPTVAICPRCCPTRRWTAPRARRAPVNSGAEGFMPDPWRRG